MIYRAYLVPHAGHTNVRKGHVCCPAGAQSLARDTDQQPGNHESVIINVMIREVQGAMGAPRQGHELRPGSQGCLPGGDDIDVVWRARGSLPDEHG